MNKISTRDIQVFVGGALALYGFNSLIKAPFILFLDHTKPAAAMSFVSLQLLSGLTLIIAIGLLNGNTRALMWAKIVLYIAGISGCVSAIMNLATPSTNSLMQILGVAPAIFISITLLVLLYWSDSKSVKEKSDSKKPNPDDTESG